MNMKISIYFQLLKDKLFRFIQLKNSTILKNDGHSFICSSCFASFSASTCYSICVGLDPYFDYNEPLYDYFIPRYCPNCGKHFKNIDEFDKDISYSFPEGFGLKGDSKA